MQPSNYPPGYEGELDDPQNEIDDLAVEEEPLENDLIDNAYEKPLDEVVF